MAKKFLFQLHMWVGLGLGLLLAALGLSGSAIVYEDEISRFLNPAPYTATRGAPLSLDAILAAARAATTARGPATIIPPARPGEAAIVRVELAGREGRGDIGPSRNASVQIHVDPVSGKVVGTGTVARLPLLAFAHRLHGNFLMGPAGRRFVGWLGLAMVLLGLSGLVLWWPKKGQWKKAFILRRSARGLRFHRELHGMLGIWAFIAFIAVSFSSMSLAWPRLMGAAQPSRTAPRLEPSDTARPMTAERAVELVRMQNPGMTLRSVTMPSRSTQPIAVNYFSHGAVAASAQVDPSRARVIATRDPSRNLMAWMRPLHQGRLGPLWRIVVFLTGLLPSVFLFTGVMMWLKKRRNRIALSAPAILQPAE